MANNKYLQKLDKVANNFLRNSFFVKIKLLDEQKIDFLSSSDKV